MIDLNFYFVKLCAITKSLIESKIEFEHFFEIFCSWLSRKIYDSNNLNRVFFRKSSSHHYRTKHEFQSQIWRAWIFFFSLLNDYDRFSNKVFCCKFIFNDTLIFKWKIIAMWRETKKHSLKVEMSIKIIKVTTRSRLKNTINHLN